MVSSYLDLSIGLSIALALTATMVVLFVTPSTITTPYFALGHWNEGNEFDNIKEGNTDSTADNSRSQVNQEGLVSCLADSQEGIIVTEEEMRDCLKTVGGDEYAEDNISISENDATTGSDDNPENGIAALNEFGRDLWHRRQC